MATLKDILANGDRFAAHCGIELTEIREGYAKAQIKVEEHHLNGAGVCQGGVYFTLADLAFAAVTNSGGQVSLGVQNSITYVRSAYKGDTLIAEAEEVAPHHKLPFCEIRISNQKGELLCIVTGTAYRKRDTFEFDSLQ